MDCLGFRFCLCALFGAWLCVCESVEVDSVNALDCESTLVSPSSTLLRFCPCPFFRISALDSVDSKFLRLAFSRIFLCFLESCVSQKKKGFIPSPLAKAPKKPPLFLLRFACKPSARQTGREPRFPASSAIVAEALLPPCSNDCAPRSGREVVGAIAPTY